MKFDWTSRSWLSVDRNVANLLSVEVSQNCRGLRWFWVPGKVSFCVCIYVLYCSRLILIKRPSCCASQWHNIQWFSNGSWIIAFDVCSMWVGLFVGWLAQPLESSSTPTSIHQDDSVNDDDEEEVDDNIHLLITNRLVHIRTCIHLLLYYIYVSLLCDQILTISCFCAVRRQFASLLWTRLYIQYSLKPRYSRSSIPFANRGRAEQWMNVLLYT